MIPVVAPGRETLFAAGAWRAVVLREEDLPALQAFFEENPQYFLTVNGEPPRADEAAQEFHDRPPPEMRLEAVHVLGFVDAEGRLVAMASVLQGLLAPHVWHIAIFIVATRLHGHGVARAVHEAIEAWAVAHRAQWLRLGVVAGNAQAGRFWEKCGYREVRRREGLPMGVLTQDVRVMVKPLAGGSLAEYLALVARDRPGS